MYEIGKIYKTGILDLQTGEFLVQYESPFLVGLTYVIIIGFGLWALKFFFNIWK